MIMNKTILCGLTIDEIYGIMQSSGFRMDHARATANQIYKKGISDLSESNKLSKKLKMFIKENTLSGLFLPESSFISSDGTQKSVFRRHDGRCYETVMMSEGKRTTVCVSTQSGCRMGCPFCMTGRYGFYGNLTAGEILNQIISIPLSRPVTHVVFMGMGEPMDNIDNVLKACTVMMAEWGLAISRRNITVSTVGITGKVKQFIKESPCNLAFSLYSPFPDERRAVVPVEKTYPAIDIIEIMKSDDKHKDRRLSIAYIMIKGINDSENHLEGLIKLLKGSRIRVNLIPYHPGPDDVNRSSSEKRIQHFRHNLTISGISASVRKSRGQDISAACGLLASQFEQ